MRPSAMTSHLQLSLRWCTLQQLDALHNTAEILTSLLQRRFGSLGGGRYGKLGGDGLAVFYNWQLSLRDLLSFLSDFNSLNAVG